MTYIGVTGHRELPDEAVDFITDRVEEILDELDAPLIGYSSLAQGADQLVADRILKAGGQLHVVVPSRNYDTTFDGAAEREYRRLLKATAFTTELLFPEPSEEAYDAAGKWVAEHSDVLIAIWDGLPARGFGGTADAVAHAKALFKDVRIVWPRGTRR